MLSTKMTCPESLDGCVWTGTIREFQRHSGECSFYKIPCDCGKVNIRLNDVSHKSVCSFRQVECDFCGEDGVKVCDMKDHLKDCQELGSFADIIK